MKIVVAPDSFKGSLTASQVAQAVTEGIRRVVPDAEVDQVPMADGGEGTVESLVHATGGRILSALVSGPLGDPVAAAFGILGDGETAVIEMAAASGLPLVAETLRDPLRTTTWGTGELIRAALDAGCRRLIVGVGGSATVDGGAGMAQALGVGLLDAEGHGIPLGGGGLSRLAHLDLTTRDARIARTLVKVACDVRNPLLGPEGAATVYGPQKGASPGTVLKLEEYLGVYADLIERELGIAVRDVPGAGAAGGLGAGLMAFLGAELVSGVDVVIEAVHLADRVKDADLVFTGEGQIDAQTVFGKTAVGVARTARRFGRPVVAVAGRVTEDGRAVYDCGIDAVIPITNGPVSLEEAMRYGARLVADASERAMRLALLRI